MRMRRYLRAGLKKRNQESGLTLIELLIAMLVLAAGLVGLMAIIVAAIAGNNRNKLDTTSTLLSQMVIEQLSNVPATVTRTIVVQDCNGASWNISTDSGGVGADTGAPVDSNRDIDFTSSYTTDGYSMRFVVCGAAGTSATYDVRWHIYQPNAYEKVVVVSTRLLGTGSLTGVEAISYSKPVQLKTVLGS